MYSMPDQDHPRVCGEKFNDPPVLEPELGSPPHMRGKASAEPGLAGKVGITPAYAGKSHSLSGFSASIWDHPRVCGEKEQLPYPNTS